MAKNDKANEQLQAQFQERRVRKRYIGLVDGSPPTERGRVEAPIGRDPKDRKRLAVTRDGKGRNAVTEYSTLESFRNHSLLSIFPITGRTHQIRIHMAFLGCPIAGDTIYGRRKPTIVLHRHFLHAESIELCLPGEATSTKFQAEMPHEIEDVLIDLRVMG